MAHLKATYRHAATRGCSDTVMKLRGADRVDVMMKVQHRW